MSRAVIDQPGVRILVVGLALSATIGLTLKALISEERVQAQINRAVERLQADFFVDYDGARVSLSSWGLPMPSLVVNNIRMSPKGNQCQSSQIYVGELEVPVSLQHIFGFSKSIPKLRLRDVELRLSDIDTCAGMKTASKNVTTSQARGEWSPAASGDTTSKNIFNSRTRAELNEISVEKLKIVFADKPEQPLVLKQMNIELGYAEGRLRRVNLKSKLNALRDSRADIYFLSGDLNVAVHSKDSGEMETAVTLKGKILDGDLQLFVHAIAGTGKVSYELGLEQVSLKALWPLVNEAADARFANLEKLSAALSADNKGEIFLDGTGKSKFGKIQIQIDSGFLQASDIKIEYADNRLKVQPFELNIEMLSLSKLKGVETFKKRLDSFESLGDFTGRLNFVHENDFSLKGKLQNVTAVFSNRGRRDLQSIEQVGLEMLRKDKELQIIADGFVVNGQPITARLQGSMKSDTGYGQASFQARGMTLSSRVWEQFTFVEQSPKVNLLWNYKRQSEDTHDIKIGIDDLLLPGVKLENLHIDLMQTISTKPENETLALTVRPRHLLTDETMLENEILSQIFSIDGYDVRAMTSDKTRMSLSGNNWKNLSFELESVLQSSAKERNELNLRFRGRVQEEAGLNSQLHIQGKNISRHFELTSSPGSNLMLAPVTK